MTKHIGPIVAWIVVTGIALYVVRHHGDLVVGVSAVRQLIDDGIRQAII